MTSVPVTDAFDESEAMDQLEVELPPAQIEWLEEMAEKQGVSVGHVLRAVVMGQMRESEASPSAPAYSGDGKPPSFSEEVEEMGKDATDAIPDSNERSAENDCLLDRLRSFSKKLEEPAGNGTLTRGEEQADEAPVGEAPLGEGASAEEGGSIEEGGSDDRGSSASDARATKRRSAPEPSVGAGRSMFDMVEE